MEEKGTITVELPKGVPKEELQKFLDREAKRTHYIGYSCGEIWVVRGTSYADARSLAIDKFIEKFQEVLPPDVNKKDVEFAIMARKLGKEYAEDIKGVIENIHRNHDARTHKKGQKGGRKRR